jgi:hypothetical protein
VGGSIEAYCGGGPCPSLSEARATRQADLERACQGADGSPRILRHFPNIFTYETFLFDAAGALVGVVYGYREPGGFCGGASYNIHYGDTAGDCDVEYPSYEGCPRSDAGQVVRPCVLTAAGAADAGRLMDGG